MPYKRHPYYDESTLDDWLTLEDPALKDLAGEILASCDHLKSIGLERVRFHAGENYLAERPFPEVNQILARPLSGAGFRIYIEYFFYQKPNENSPDSDFWWVILNCPASPLQSRTIHVVDLGRS